MPDPIVPPRPLYWDSSVERLREIIAPDVEVYLVGGAVRDAYLGRPLHDIDLATPGDGRPLARRLANALSGAYYPLDRERGVGRALVPWHDRQLTIDVAQFRGPDLETDLSLRDFTLNAMAVRLTGDLQAVFDPTGGLVDLEAKRLRQCAPGAIADDPVRVLRAVRASVSFGLVIETQTRAAIRASIPALDTISAERIRDEFFQILDVARPSAALAALDQLGVLAHVVPETTAMHEIVQGAPHQFNLWQHTLKTVAFLATFIHVIEPGYDENLTANVQAGAAAYALHGVRTNLREHLGQVWPDERSHRALLVLAALLHDAGKPEASTADEQGRIHFHGHELIGETLAENRARELRLSSNEVERLATIVRNHMRPHWLATEPELSRRAIYRFWRDTGPAGVDVCLLAMADYVATYGVTLDAAQWSNYLERIQALLHFYFNQVASDAAPPPLLSGQDLLDHFDLTPGPRIGVLLEHLREAQAVGEVTTKKEALDRIQRLLDDEKTDS